MGRKPILPQGANAFTAGAKLRQLRIARTITLEELGKRIGYTKGYLSAVENGKERINKELLQKYVTALDLEEDLGELLQTQYSTSLVDAITYLVKNASVWSTSLNAVLFSRGIDSFILDSIDDKQNTLQQDKMEQRHLEFALRNAAEQGLIELQTIEERDQYRNMLTILSEPSPGSEELRRNALYQFTHAEVSILEDLNAACIRLLNIYVQTQLSVEVDMKPYISSFFQAFISQIHTDPFFRSQTNKLFEMGTILPIYRKPMDIIVTLNQLYDTLPNHYTPEQFGRDVVAYTKFVESTLRHLKLVGVVPKDRMNTDAELNGIFVPPRVALENRPQLEIDNDYSLLAMLEQYPYVVLLGGPGSGKSTITRHLALSQVLANMPNTSHQIEHSLLGDPLPLRIELRHFSEYCRHSPGYNFLSYITDMLLRHDVNINPHMFEVLLERGAIFLLFDGLDEVVTLDERKRLVQEIEHFTLNFPSNRILITSRPVGYELAPCPHHIFTHAQVQNFNDEQIQHFLQSWYTYVLKLPSPIPSEDQIELNILLETLKNNQRLHKLAETPLLLTVITALHRYERLPDKRVLVYDRCADLLLDTWARLKGTDARWKDMKMIKEDQYACVAYLGYILHERSQYEENEDTTEEKALREGASDVPTTFLLQEIETFLNNRMLITEVSEQRAEAERFLELMQVETGLIVARGTDENGQPLYGFVHRTFQEYFAAVDIYERFLEAVDVTVISDFLKKHLHDPHWHEVILLLLGKLKIRPVTSLLQHILTGEIKSRRSLYTNIVKQDIFFVSSCMIEEVSVQQELAEQVVSQLVDLVRQNLFPLRSEEALERLGSLMQTRQYANLVGRKLIVLVDDKVLLDTSTAFTVALILFHNKAILKEDQIIFQFLEHLVQRSDFLVPLAVQSELDLYSSNRLEQSQSVVQLLAHLVQFPNLSSQKVIAIAQEIYQHSAKESKERQLAFQLISRLVQQSDLQVEQALEYVTNLFQFSFKDTRERQQALQLFVYLVQHSNISAEQAILQVAPLIRGKNVTKEPEEEQIIDDLLIYLAQRPDLAVEQAIKCAKSLYGSFDLHRKQANLLVYFAQRLDLSVEHAIQAAKIIYQDGKKTRSERNLAAYLLVYLAQRPDLAVEQAIQVTQTLYQPVPRVSEERRLADQLLVQLTQRPDLTVEQAIWVAETLYPDSRINPPRFGQQERKYVTELLMSLIQRPNLSVEQSIRVVQALFRISRARFEISHSIQLLLSIANDQMLPLEQRLEAIKTIFTARSFTWFEAVQIVRILLVLLDEKEFGEFLDKYWVTSVRLKEALSDVPFLVELAQQEIAPIRIRNWAYSALSRMVPKFDQLVLSNAEPIS